MALVLASGGAVADPWTTADGTIEGPAGWQVAESHEGAAIFAVPTLQLRLAVFGAAACTPLATELAPRPAFVDSSWTSVSSESKGGWALQVCRPSVESFSGGVVGVKVWTTAAQPALDRMTRAQQDELARVLPLFAAMYEQRLLLMVDADVREAAAGGTTTFAVHTYLTAALDGGWVYVGATEGGDRFVHQAARLEAFFTMSHEVRSPCDPGRARPIAVTDAGTWLHAGTLDALQGVLWLCRERWQGTFVDHDTLIVHSLRAHQPFGAMPPEVASAVGALGRALSTALDERARLLAPQAGPSTAAAPPTPTFTTTAITPITPITPPPDPDDDDTAAHPTATPDAAISARAHLPRPLTIRVGFAVRELEAEGIFGDDKLGPAASVGMTKLLRPRGAGLGADVIGGLAGEVGYSSLGLDFDAQARLGLRVGHGVRLAALVVGGADAVDTGADPDATSNRHMPPGVYGGAAAILSAMLGGYQLTVEGQRLLRRGDIVDREVRIGGAIAGRRLELGLRRSAYELVGERQLKVWSLIVGTRL